MTRLRWVIGTIAAVLVYAALIAASSAYSNWDAQRGDQGIGIIGVGLIWLAVEALVAFTWGGVSGLRGVTMKPLIVRWIVVGCTVGAIASIRNQIGDVPVDWMSLLSDLILLGVGSVAILCVAALAGWGVGAAFHRKQAQRRGAAST